jgi:5-methylcytosine-specific restriction endonuclease McrA
MTFPVEALQQHIAIVGKTGSGKTADPDYYRNWARANATHLREYRAAYYQRNKERMLARSKARYVTPEGKAAKRVRDLNAAPRENARRRAMRRTEPTLVRARERAVRAKRPDLKRAKDARWRAANPEKLSASIARSKRARPDLYREHAVQSRARRRARRKAAETVRFTSASIVARDRSSCHLCGLRVARADRSLDHLIPIARSGAHAPWNVALAHLRCNKRRGVKQILYPETMESAIAYLASKQ